MRAAATAANDGDTAAIAAVAVAASKTTPVPISYVNTGDCYAESGDPDGLLEKYGLTADRIVEAARSVKANS